MRRRPRINLENISMDTKDEVVALVLRSLKNKGKLEELRKELR
jgi:hypothetical protein